MAYLNFSDLAESSLPTLAILGPQVGVLPAPMLKTIQISADGYPPDQMRYQTVKRIVGPMGVPEPSRSLTGRKRKNRRHPRGALYGSFYHPRR